MERVFRLTRTMDGENLSNGASGFIGGVQDGLLEHLQKMLTLGTV